MTGSQLSLPHFFLFFLLFFFFLYSFLLIMATKSVQTTEATTSNRKLAEADRIEFCMECATGPD